MNKLAVATNNKNKLKEINHLFEFNKIDNIAIFSINDLDVIKEADKLNISMIFTKRRLFSH